MIYSKGFSGSCFERGYRSPTVRRCPVLRIPVVPLVVVVRAEGQASNAWIANPAKRRADMTWVSVDLAWIPYFSTHRFVAFHRSPRIYGAFFPRETIPPPRQPDEADAETRWSPFHPYYRC